MERVERSVVGVTGIRAGEVMGVDTVRQGAGTE